MGKTKGENFLSAQEVITGGQTNCEMRIKICTLYQMLPGRPNPNYQMCRPNVSNGKMNKRPAKFDTGQDNTCKSYIGVSMRAFFKKKFWKHKQAKCLL